MTVLVTGAAGFIGNVLCKKLKEQGKTVVGVDLNPIYHNYCDTKVITSYVDPTLTFTGPDYEAIYHLGANSLLGPSVKNPLSYYKNNVSGMVNLLKNIVDKKNGAFIFASSAATYGDLRKIGRAHV